MLSQLPLLRQRSIALEGADKIRNMTPAERHQFLRG